MTGNKNVVGVIEIAAVIEAKSLNCVVSKSILIREREGESGKEKYISLRLFSISYYIHVYHIFFPHRSTIYIYKLTIGIKIAIQAAAVT